MENDSGSPHSVQSVYFAFLLLGVVLGLTWRA
jgi:hypothetical protein